MKPLLKSEGWWQVQNELLLGVEDCVEIGQGEEGMERGHFIVFVVFRL